MQRPIPVTIVGNSRANGPNSRPGILLIVPRAGSPMKRVAMSLAFALALTSSAATAQERAGDAALGALSGAVVLGPIGAVAGAFVGYAAGPSIANAWGLRRSSPHRHLRRSTAIEPNPNIAQNPPTPAARPEMPAAAPVTRSLAPISKSASVAPPVQPLE